MRGIFYHSKKPSIGQASISSQNSRFTIIRPKNPTDVSVSSKGHLDDNSLVAGSEGATKIPVSFGAN
jgi:hypothetical protein